MNVSGGVGGGSAVETEPEKADKLDCRYQGMASAMQVTEPIQPFDGQRKGNQEPADEHAVGMMMADMLHAVAIFGIVETLVLDLPSAFGNLKKGAATHF